MNTEEEIVGSGNPLLRNAICLLFILFPRFWERLCFIIYPAPPRR
jgi:hypothetical protein